MKQRAMIGILKLSVGEVQINHLLGSRKWCQVFCMLKQNTSLLNSGALCTKIRDRFEMILDNSSSLQPQ